ncbi:MAG: HAD family hydrolase [Paracoccaceae bacterium]
MRVIVFDLDGTLLDTGLDMMAAANRTFKAAGYQAQLSPSDRAIVVQGGRQMFRALFEREGLEFTDTDLMALYQKFVEDYRNNICVHTAFYPEAEQALLWCKENGYSVALCTNKPQVLTDALIEALGIEKLFDHVVTPQTLGIAKPNAEPLLHAIKLAKADVSNALMVGDTITDVDAARNAQCPVLTVAFDQSVEAMEKLNPDMIIQSYSAFPSTVAEHFKT